MMKYVEKSVMFLNMYYIQTPKILNFIFKSYIIQKLKKKKCHISYKANTRISILKIQLYQYLNNTENPLTDKGNYCHV